MSKLPKLVAFVAWLFIVVGISGLVYHANEFNAKGLFEGEIVWAAFIRLLAIVGGVLLLRKISWARWLLLLWVVYHVVLSTMHSAFELTIHCVVLIVVAYIFLRPATMAYFMSLKSNHEAQEN
ncbi:MAG: hypothetical protein HY276_05310 [Ignavibacteriales bacterium]|nr:hypothetical protein [Ignavibacteriales bacterium]MBI3787660.1 hypothetical protein [Ignavibacteriales bacterium]